MSKQKLSIRFVISNAKTNKKGLCPISCRLTLNGKRKPFATGLFVNPQHWNSKQQEVVGKSNESHQTNLQIQIISSEITKAYLQLQLSNDDFTVEDVFHTYLGKPTIKEVGVIEYFVEFLGKRKKLIGIDIQMATWKKFNYAYLQLKDFIKWKFGKGDVELSSLKLQFLLDLEYYLKTERTQSQVTINKAIQRFRSCIKTAVGEGYLIKDPFTLHKPRTVKKNVVFLSNEELERLENHVFVQPRLQLIQDLFVFCCYTGLAYNEMLNLKREHIVKGFDGNEWIQMKRAKTGKLISVPLLPKAKSTIYKYKDIGNRVLPKFSNQKINSYLKEIAGIVGINKSMSHHMARKTFASTVLLYNDVPMEIVSELLGHSSLKITQEHYGKIVQRKVGTEMERLSIKLSSK